MAVIKRRKAQAATSVDGRQRRDKAMHAFGGVGRQAARLSADNPAPAGERSLPGDAARLTQPGRIGPAQTTYWRRLT